MARSSEAISPTAHYTGYAWFHHGMSHEALVTPQGRLLFNALRPLSKLAQVRGRPTAEGFLLARHRAMDGLLEQAISEGRVTQVIEVAAGFSPRGWDFKRRHGSRLRYVEADLPHMAERKLQRLERAGLLLPGHRVQALDALADSGPMSLSALADRLDPAQGTAIITEGLLNYFDRESVRGMWRRFAAVLSRFPQGLYLSDLHLARENRTESQRAFARMLSAFVRGRLHLHFSDSEEAIAELRAAGFDTAGIHDPRQLPQVGRTQPGAELVRVVEARTGP
ncbi:class I SAM-dependent methyltransferase [Solimonas sp. K1W22B-7]|uniref:class I SAM-dependent methyltransferase n=1 Tax=Solimonas sp. K1W22B-7 TaxID=2303331 RepID=UPI000E32DE6B|nr:class I SAM-dependent methyltransferase [Solimonas sp. K1W22B-7]AXQ30154.1 class I SAM-dependent methyltransferase [Solimonas sp. K1W22B-7]